MNKPVKAWGGKKKVAKEKDRNKKPFLIIAILILTAGIGVWFFLGKLETAPPEIQIVPDIQYLGKEQVFEMVFQDEQTGIKGIYVQAEAGGEVISLLRRTFPKTGFLGLNRTYSHKVRIPVSPEILGIKEGEAVIRISCEDFSFRRWFSGNLANREIPLIIDTRPPLITAISPTTNINPGGSGLVIYEMSENCPRHGVRAGDTFFPGQPADTLFRQGANRNQNRYTAVCFFALSHDQGNATRFRIEGEDDAGNRTETGFPFYIRTKTFRNRTLPVSDRFLQRKMPEFRNLIPDYDKKSLLEQYLYVNRQLRKQNYETFVKISEKTRPEKLWEGPFLRMPNTERMAAFADRRAYQYNGQTVDHQIHMGVDLASVANAPVPASGSGIVVFADYLGIYGQTVVIDHGFGIKSLYSHLSGYEVNTGDFVQKGKTIGRTGTTGLAGGDHLHFGMMVHHVFVNPIEWWDGKWIKDNILSKLEVLGQGS